MPLNRYVIPAVIVLVVCAPLTLSTPATAATNSQSDRISWTVNVDDADVTDIVVTDDRIYAAAGPTLTAVDRDTGQIVWSETFDLSTLDQLDSIHRAGDYLVAVDTNLGDDVLYAVDAQTGQRAYTTEVDGMDGGALGTEETLYTTTTAALSEDCLQARDPASGTTDWAVCRESASMASVDGDGSRLYLTGAGETITVQPSTQQVLWSGQGSTTLPPFVLDNQVFVYTGTDTANNEFTPHFIGYDKATGTRDYAFEVSHESFEITHAAAAGTYAALSVGNRFDLPNTLALYNLTAETEAAELTLSSATAVLDGTENYIYRATTNGTLFAYGAADLREEFAVQLGGGEPTAIAASDTGVFVGDRSGNLVAVEPPTSAASFEVVDFDAPTNVTQGDSVTVTATVRNTGGSNGTATVGYLFDTDSDGDLVTRATRTVAVPPGETREVTFDLPTADLAAATHTHGVGVGETTRTATLRVTEPPASGVAVALQPRERTVATNQTVTFDAVVRGFDGGVGGYDLTVNSSNGSVAPITGLADRANGTAERTIAADETGARIATFGANTSDTGPVTVATVTVEGRAAGAAELRLHVASVSDERGLQYTVGNTTGGTLTVREDALPPVVDDRVPTDPDGDGKYEDLNGDGQTTPGDATVLFNAIFSADSAVRDHVTAYDFNDDGQLTPGDATVLFREIF